VSKIFVTGASGFIGQSICKHLINSKYTVCGGVRDKTSIPNTSMIKYLNVGDIALQKNWKNILAGYDCVIHCAGRAHVINEIKINSLETYRLINLKSTAELAKQCSIAGVKRMIFLSSIGVLGSNTNNRKPFLYSDKPNPTENYALSKYEAEQELFKISKETGLEIVVIRPPLVYGPFAPGNLKRLIRIISYGIPLPFGLINNKKSLIGIDNLIDFITLCIEHPSAVGKTFLVSDNEDISTPDLISSIAYNMGRSTRLFPLPIALLKLSSQIIGRQSEINRLIGSLQVDTNYTRKLLNWTPPLSFKEGIRRMIKLK